MKIFIFLFFLVAVVNSNQFIDHLASLSINEFYEFLLESGYYHLIFNIKYSTNENVANIVCKGFVPSPYCEDLIKSMKIPSHRVSTSKIHDLKPYLLTEDFFPILYEYYNEEQINVIIAQMNNVLKNN